MLIKPSQALLTWSVPPQRPLRQCFGPVRYRETPEDDRVGRASFSLSHTVTVELINAPASLAAGRSIQMRAMPRTPQRDPFRNPAQRRKRTSAATLLNPTQEDRARQSQPHRAACTAQAINAAPSGAPAACCHPGCLDDHPREHKIASRRSAACEGRPLHVEPESAVARSPRMANDPY